MQPVYDLHAHSIASDGSLTPTELVARAKSKGVDVLAEVKKACDKHGIKLALYFSEGDWSWSPGRGREG